MRAQSEDSKTDPAEQCKEEVEQVVTDCVGVINQHREVLNQAAVYIEALEKENSVLLIQQDELIRETEKLRDDKNAWYRDPWIMLSIGVLGGAAAGAAVAGK